MQIGSGLWNSDESEFVKLMRLSGGTSEKLLTGRGGTGPWGAALPVAPGYQQQCLEWVSVFRKAKIIAVGEVEQAF